VLVALLGITAAGVALTLTAASRVVFAELYWTPAALLQAEDRAHRIGQTSEVVIEYLLADDCVDDVLWPCIQHKMLLLGELFENQKRHTMRADLAPPEPRKRKTPAKPDDDWAGDELVELEELEELHHEDPEALDVENVDDVDAGAAARARISSPATRSGGSSILIPAPSASSPQQVRPRKKTHFDPLPTVPTQLARPGLPALADSDASLATRHLADRSDHADDLDLDDDDDDDDDDDACSALADLADDNENTPAVVSYDDNSIRAHLSPAKLADRDAASRTEPPS